MSCRFGQANHSQMLSAPLSVFAMQSLSVVHDAWVGGGKGRRTSSGLILARMAFKVLMRVERK